MTKPRETKQKKASPELPDAFYRITALLHTMRCIAQHEDRLCLLRNEIKRTQAVGPRLMKELMSLLEELPSVDYTHDLQAVQAALSSASSAAKTVRSPAKKSAAKTPQRKRTPVPAKQSA